MWHIQYIQTHIPEIYASLIKFDRKALKEISPEDIAFLQWRS